MMPADVTYFMRDDGQELGIVLGREHHFIGDDDDATRQRESVRHSGVAEREPVALRVLTVDELSVLLFELVGFLFGQRRRREDGAVENFKRLLTHEGLDRRADAP